MACLMLITIHFNSQLVLFLESHTLLDSCPHQFQVFHGLMLSYVYTLLYCTKPDTA